MAFVRRFTFNPGASVIGQIEGVVILDLPPPGQIQGVGTGTVAVVGEFADMSFGVSVDASGVVTTKCVPTEVFGSTDLLNKTGPFDETIGEFGVSDGNGFVAIRNKKFSRLIVAVVNLASSRGTREIRHLPSNTSATLATPVIPMQAAVVVAGREFKSGSNRVRVAKTVTFTGDSAYDSGTDGAFAMQGAGVTQTMTSAGGAFLTTNGGIGVKKGDIIVLGSLAAAAMSDNLAAANAGSTYRINSVTNATTLVIERMDGASFSLSSLAAIAWRIHISTTADSGAHTDVTQAGGFLIPARPLDATIAAGSTLAPTVVPTAETASTWDVLSGLKLLTMPGGTDLVYTAAVQAANAVSSSALDALYVACFSALLSEDLPAREVNIVWPARTSTIIRSTQKQHVLTASAVGLGRRTPLSPEINQLTESTVLGDSDPGVGANRDARVAYGWPGAKTFIPEAVPFSLKLADGALTGSDVQHPAGVLDTRLDGWLSSIFSLLPPERNPGQTTAPIPDIMSSVLGIQNGVSGLSMADYIQFRAKGIMALRIDRTQGPIIQSGVTTSLTSGLKNYARQAMADFIEDSLAISLAPFEKQPLTEQLKDDEVAEVVSFLQGLLSPDNRALQRIRGYTVDDKSGNTIDLQAQGINVIIVQVANLASQDDLVIQAQIGESVGVQISIT